MPTGIHADADDDSTKSITTGSLRFSDWSMQIPKPMANVIVGWLMMF